MCTVLEMYIQVHSENVDVYKRQAICRKDETMNFELTPQQKAVQQSARQFAQTVLQETVLEDDAAGRFPEEAYKKMGEMGFVGLPFPKEYGGQGGDCLLYTSLGGNKMIGIGSDHGGYALKQAVIKHLEEKGYAVKDYGCYSEESCDYPVYAKAVANAVKDGEVKQLSLIHISLVHSVCTSFQVLLEFRDRLLLKMYSSILHTQEILPWTPL